MSQQEKKAYPSANSVVMEMYKCLGYFLFVSAISVQFPGVQEVLGERDPVRDVVAA